jgi:hypothetical protein
MSNNRTFISDNKGRWVGSVTSNTNGNKTYSDAKGNVVARVNDNRTYDNKGSFKGYGDQGQRLFK